MLLNTCTENSIKGNDNSPPGRRDYVLTIDTLNIPFTTLQRIWGTSPQDVWAIAPGGDSDKRKGGKMERSPPYTNS